MKKAVIYTGGCVFPEGVTEHPEQGDLIIAADSGWRNAQLSGVTPDILLGDFDSLGEPSEADGLEILRVPAEKDLTDTQLAVQVALERGADDITVVGGLSGRLDHTLSNLAILEDLQTKKIPAVLTDGQNRVRYLQNGSMLLARSPFFRYVSLVTVTAVSKGVDIEGVKYPLHNATLKRTNQYAVSNEILNNCALIAVRKGSLWVVESRD